MSSNAIDFAVTILLLILMAAGWLRGLASLDKNDIKPKELREKQKNI